MAAKVPTFLEEISENFLLCGICSDRYKNPKILPCFHSFCEPCLGKLAGKSGGLTCPICRRSHKLPGSGVSGLDNNPFLNDLVDLLKNRENEHGDSAKCDGCKQGDQAKHCIECSIAICSNCAATHTLIPMTKSHRLVSIDEYRSAKSADPASVQPPVYCSKHPNYEIEFYCDTCDKAICLKCTALDHSKPEHQYRCITEAAKDYTKEVTAMFDKMKTKEVEANDSKTAVAETLESLDACFKREKKKLQDHTHKTKEEITRLVDENSDKLLKEMEAEYENRKVNLNAQLKELEIMGCDLSSAREYAEKLVNYGKATHLMSAKIGMSTKMEQVLKGEGKREPKESDYLEFKPCDNFCKSKTLGMIRTEMLYTLTDVPIYRRVDEDIVVTMAPEAKPANPRASTGKVESVLKAPDGSTEKVQVNHRGNGTVTLKARAKIEGEHELSVSVRKKAVQGSPVRVKVIPKKGLLYKFGERGEGVGQLKEPYGIKITRKKGVLVCDHDNGRLQTFSTKGKHHNVFQFRDFANAKPNDVAFSLKGDFFMTDEGNRQVIVCDENGKVIKCFGKGKITTPIGISISPVNGMVYVVDFRQHCIHIYDQDGNHIKSFGREGSKEGEFNRPLFICIDDKGNVYVTDANNRRIQVFDGDGHFLYSFGSKGSGDGQLSYPLGVAVDKHGYVYVSDCSNLRIVKYESGGKFVCRVDSDGDGLSRPYGICVTDDEPFAKVLVADCGNGCVKVFAQ